MIDVLIKDTRRHVQVYLAPRDRTYCSTTRVKASPSHRLSRGGLAPKITDSS